MDRLGPVKKYGIYLAAIFIGIGITLGIKAVIVTNVQVPTSSMEKTIAEGSRLIVNRTAYWTSRPERGDIVVFPCPDTGERYIKRIIGLSGETIEGKGGSVYIDGQQLEEPYLTSEEQDDFGPFKIPEGQYFMMGDNRNHSWDSRYWSTPFVKGSDIVGKAVAIYFPEWKII